MTSITPCLWFDGRVDEALDFYTSLFGDAAILDRTPGPDGQVLTARLHLAGQDLMILNGGPHFALTPAFSLFLSVEGQDEVDKYWDALCDGGEPSQCGWLVDRFGVSWQVVPTILGELLGGSDPEGSGRAMQALLAMTKLDVAALQAAYDG